MILTLYKSLLRPILEYGNIIWGPHFTLDQRAIEHTQRRATKLVLELKDSEYVEQLEALDLPSLLYRRTRLR